MRSAYTRPLRVLMVDNDDSFTCIAAVRIPSELEVTARTADGEVMGVRHRTHPIEGVQFHPESVLTPEGPPMLENFLSPGAAPLRPSLQLRSAQPWPSR